MGIKLGPELAVDSAMTPTLRLSSIPERALVTIEHKQSRILLSKEDKE